MRLLLNRYESLLSLSAAMLTALAGGFCAWLVFRLWGRSHPFLCAAAMGYFSGLAGGGAWVLLVHILVALGPIGGIGSTMR